MKKHTTTIIKISILLAAAVFFCVINVAINKKNYIRRNTFESKNEYLKTIDCADIFDRHPGSSFIIAFDACSSVEGDVLVYMQNSSLPKYSFNEYVHMTPEMKHYEIEVTPELVDSERKESFLSFFGTYNTGVIPKVQLISVTPCSDNRAENKN